MSTPRRGESPPCRCNPAPAMFLSDIGGLAGLERPLCAVLRPHSSVPLVVAVGGVTSGGIASTSYDPRRTAPPIDWARRAGTRSLTDREGDGVCRVFKSPPAVPVAFGTCVVGVNRP